MLTTHCRPRNQVDQDMQSQEKCSFDLIEVKHTWSMNCRDLRTSSATNLVCGQQAFSSEAVKKFITSARHDCDPAVKSSTIVTGMSKLSAAHVGRMRPNQTMTKKSKEEHVALRAGKRESGCLPIADSHLGMRAPAVRHKTVSRETAASLRFVTAATAKQVTSKFLESFFKP